MKNVDLRLMRLEEHLRPRGCAYCQRWIGAVVRDETGACSRPQICPSCGRDVPYEHIVALHGVALAEL
ncbi:MAG: hypothetical protein ACJ789_11315 [Thermomicrobiales bacterium]